MGTLTGNTDRLADYCVHKLPTSCRLTSIPRCCACADERAHSATYPTYIDGVGFVPRGNRWQRYCWFCKEFWEHRVATTNLRPTQTRIPEVPDQTEFLEKWYEFHQGHRIVRKEDGTEERQAVLGEPWMDVSPGHLPRTLDELRAGHARSAADQQQRITIEEDAQATGPSLDETLDQMLNTADEETPAAPPPQRSSTDQQRPVHIAGHAMQSAGSRNREYQARRISALQRELHRLRQGVERVITGLRDLGEAVPEHAEATERLARLDMSLNSMALEHNSSNIVQMDADEVETIVLPPTRNERGLEGIQRRIDQAGLRHQQAIREREDAGSRLEDANQYLSTARDAHALAQREMLTAEANVRTRNLELVRTQNERRTAENYMRVFGTREDMEREDYVSPIGGMFNRAWDRFRDAEETRREERTLRQVLEDEQHVDDAIRTHAETAENRAADTVLDDIHQRQNSVQVDPNVRITTSGFPQSMLDRVRALSDEEHQGRIEYMATLDAQRAAQRVSDRPAIASSPGNILEHLLRDTPEPDRSAIIARMTENGTAQALLSARSGERPNPMTLFPRLHHRDRQTSLAPSGGASMSTDYPEVVSSSDTEDEDDPHQGLDNQDDNRPEPRNDEDLTVKMDCRVCYTQMADTACLPCGHLVFCRWCSEQHSPVMAHDKTRPRRPVGCPVCRKRVRQKVRIYRS